MITVWGLSVFWWGKKGLCGNNSFFLENWGYRSTLACFSPPSFIFFCRSGFKCVAIKRLSMKKSARPSASKVNGDRGKSETGSTGKSAPKSLATAPLPKVRLVVRWPFSSLYALSLVLMMFPFLQVKSNDDLLAAVAGGNPASNCSVTKTKKTASVGTTASNLESRPKSTLGQ